MPVLLQPDAPFPDPAQADADGLVAVGGEMSVARLLEAYGRGIFPWSVKPVTWWSPDPRGILELDGFHVSRSLARTLRQERFTVTRDQAFADVIAACAEPRPASKGVWITEEFIAAYVALHRAGQAHSVECWREGRLVGGVYGVAVGGAFAGESMFHRETDASKGALHHLVGHLQARGFGLFDVQTVTPATAALGAKQIPRAEYLKRLTEAVTKRCEF